MDKLAALKAFVAVVEEGGFAAAGRALGATRAQLSRQIRALEDDLGAQLFNRSTRRVVPTESGAAYYQRATALISDLEDADRAVAQLSDEPRGSLHVNAPMSFGTMHLARAVAGFMASYPEIRIQLTLNDRLVDPYEEGFDLTIRIAQLTDSDLIARRIAPARMVLCASPDYLARHGEPVHPDQLGDHACLHYGLLQRGNSWHLIGPEREHRVAIDGILCSNNGQVLREAALNGLGVAMLPTFMVGADLQEGQLRTILPDAQPQSASIHALYPPSRYLSAKVRLFIDHLAEVFGPEPYWDLVR